VRRAVEHHWPSLLVGAACAGLAASNIVSIAGPVLALGACLSLAAVALLTERARVIAIGAALVVAGLWWGGLRLDAMASTALADEMGESAAAELVVVGPARTTAWAVRVQAEVTRFGDSRIRERVLLVLPVGRSPPRGAILETVVRIAEPREPEGGFDERAWLASLDRFGIISPRAVLLTHSTLAQNLAIPFTLEIEPVPVPGPKPGDGVVQPGPFPQPIPGPEPGPGIIRAPFPWVLLLPERTVNIGGSGLIVR